MDFSEEELFDVLKQEKARGELMPLPKDFYRRFSQNERASQNISKTLFSLKEKRTQKLLVYMAYGKQLPQPLPAEEEEAYNRIKQILKKENADKTSTKIKINTDLPEILTPNNSKLGPFKQNEIVELREPQDIKFIIENKIGEILEK